MLMRSAAAGKKVRLNRLAFRFEGQVVLNNLTLHMGSLLVRLLGGQPGAQVAGGPPPALPAKRLVRGSPRHLWTCRR